MSPRIARAFQRTSPALIEQGEGIGHKARVNRTGAAVATSRRRDAGIVSRAEPGDASVRATAAVWVVVAVVAVLGVAPSPARAQAVPLPDGSVAVAAGFESLALPSLVVDVGLHATPAFQPVVQARWSLPTAAVGVAGGGAWQQSVGDVVFFRETVLGGPFLATVDGVAPGARLTAQALAGFRLGEAWTLTVGPELVAVATLDGVPGGAVDGRVGIAVVGGARWFVVPTTAVTLSLAGGYDVGGRGAGAVAGQALLGVLIDLPGSESGVAAR
jgi:hypothetical protein